MAAKVTKDLAHHIDGRAIGFAGEPRLDVVNPFTGETLAGVPLGGEAAVDAAVDAARRAGPAWRRTPLPERIGRVEALARRVEQGREELARILVAEIGKPIRHARTEVDHMLAALRYFAAEAPAGVRDDEIARDATFVARIERRPVGVVAAIAPFNFPLLLLSWKLGPAVLAGCTVVCKPDPRTPLATSLLADWATAAGWPPGVFNVVHGARDAGERLVGHPGVAKVAFTGSVDSGRAVYRRAAEGIKRVLLELGGCSALVVCDDGDFNAHMTEILHRAFYNSGQYCFRINRALVARARYEEFTRALSTAAAGLVVGDPSDERTDLGPLIDEAALTSVHHRIDNALACGARLLLDGRRAGPGRAPFLGPTVLADVPRNADVMRSETFGPVLAAAPFDTIDDGIALANETPYGLAAFALTGDFPTATRLSEELEAGTVWINAISRSLIELPFGGIKQSGIGLEKSARAFDEYLVPRALYLGGHAPISGGDVDGATGRAPDNVPGQ